MTPEQIYIANTTLEHRKRFAQFFTPACIAEIMCEWVLKGTPKSKILEPAYGLGIFSRILAQTPGMSIDAYEIDRTIHSYAMINRPECVNLLNEDYFHSGWEEEYDAIICNPPYLKFHDYDNIKYISDVNIHLNTKLNGFTNFYTLFLLKSVSQLKRNGRLAYIVPSEFLNSDYGVEVKRWLIKNKLLHHIIVLDFTENAFDNALTTACIILCEKTGQNDIVRFSLVSKVERLDSYLTEYKEYNISDLDAEAKWKIYYEGGFGDRYRKLVPFSRFASVSRGIATGANDYFTFNRTKADNYNIPSECLTPCICKAIDAPKIFFSESDFQKLVHRDRTVYLFNGTALPDDTNVSSYLKYGEEIGINERYLTSSRTPWYSIENRRPSPIWVSVFNRKGIRFIRNEMNIHNLTTFHCVYPKDPNLDLDVLFAYLITDVAKEIFTDNSRQYGNGLVKFEPNDLNKGMAVDLSELNSSEIRFIKDVYSLIKSFQEEETGLQLLNDFFKLKFSTNQILNLNELQEKLKLLQSKHPSRMTVEDNKIHIHRIRQLNLLSLFEEYGNCNILENDCVREEMALYCHSAKSESMVLISLANFDSEQKDRDLNSISYNCGKKFPASIDLRHLFYFVPYVKNKGIRDLYSVRAIRLEEDNEICMDNRKKSLNIVFELEFYKQLFDDYRPTDLDIWRKYSITTLAELQD